MSETTTTIDTLNVNDYGVLPTGFSRMRLPEIRQAIIDQLQSRLEITLETRPDSVTGIFIDVFAEREATLWELCEAVYHAMYPISSFGVNLDHAVSFTGVTRLFAEYSTAWVSMSGVQGTVVNAGAIVRSATTQENFILLNNVTITRTSACEAEVEVLTATVGNQYQILISATWYSYTAIAGDTTITIANALALAMIPSRWIISTDGAVIRFYNIENVPLTINVAGDIAIIRIASPGRVQAEDIGPVAVLANTITQIVTTQTNWTEVNNLVSGQMGRNTETDDELRLRYANGMYQLGAATSESIRANILQNVPGILQLQVYENNTDATADGRVPHSIEVLAVGGDPEDIAQEIFNTKAAGIDTNGSITVNVIDSKGTSHPIKFSRPTFSYIWVKVTIAYYTEEIFPTNGAKQIQQVVADTGNLFGIGKDVIAQRFFGPIYRNIPGIGSITITMARTTSASTIPAAGDYSATTIAISARDTTVFVPERVSVILP